MIYGVLFSLLASVCFNLNNLLEKRAVDQMAAISARRTGHMFGQLLRSPLWVAGFVIGVVAVGVLTIAYALAPIAVVQSIFGIGIVLLVPASRIYLGEHMGRRELFGLGAIIGAIVLVSVTLGTSSSPVDHLSTTHVMIASGVTVAIAGVLFKILRSSSTDVSVAFGATCGLIYGVSALQTKSASVLLQHHGVIGGLPRVFESPYPYVFIVTSLLGLVTFQTGLQRSRITIAGPTVNIVGSAYLVAIGMIVFDEALPHDAVLSTLRFLGFGLVLVGSWILATGAAPTKEPVPLVTDDEGDTTLRSDAAPSPQ